MGLLSSCGGDDDPPDDTPGRIAILTGIGQADTVGAILPVPVGFQLLSRGGVPIPNAPLVIQAAFQKLGISTAVDGPFERSVFPVTDGKGRASVWVQVGGVGADLRIAAYTPDTSASTELTVTGLPGKPAVVEIESPDTVMGLGTVKTFSALVTDRSGYPTIPQPEWSVRGSALSHAGPVVSATAIAPGMLIATAGEVRDSIRIVVPPAGRMVGYDRGRLSAIDLDGRNEIFLAFSFAARASFLPDGDVVATMNGVLTRISPAGVQSPFLRTDAPGPVGESDALPDGSVTTSWGGRLYRVSADGQSWAPVSPEGNYARARLSPDLTFLGFERTGETAITVQTRATGAEHTLPGPATGVNWSDDSQWIASGLGYNLGIRLIRPDGSGTRILAPTWVVDLERLAWSEDGRWLLAYVIVAPGLYRNLVVEAETGMELPLYNVPVQYLADLRMR